MSVERIPHTIKGFSNLELLARKIVEGYISGIHKSPFLGFSSEFAEHSRYNPGESTRHIDWRLYAKTDELFTKRYEEETNLRCHLIIDNSSSMHYPTINEEPTLNNLNKISFSVLASACVMQLLKKQSDAVGLSVYSDTYEFYSKELGSQRHYRQIYGELNKLLTKPKENTSTKTYTYLHQIAEKLPRRSMVLLFTDMLQTEKEEVELFEALQHLTYKKHEVVLFHVLDTELEADFDFDNSPKRFTDVESGEYIDLYADQVKSLYKEEMERYLKKIESQCHRYRIQYVPVNVRDNFDTVLQAYLLERRKFK
ncbi:MAG TPA: DUF58 domain-containing protein [Flavobacteriaceae bacterium]|nr:DUF58 domain-containing protein [Flavobacteriaceae bacterium]